MAKIRVPRSWKDDVDQRPHAGVTRRDFLKRGFATSAATVMLPHALTAFLARSAFADSSSCPPQARTQGALAQIFRQGGPSVGAMFLNSAQVNLMSTNTASRYGIVATDIVQVGRNWYLAKSSPFALGLMTPPSGYSQTQWNAVLMKTSLGGHYGAFNADDGAGENTGLLGSAATFKTSALSRDLRFNNSNALASWSVGSPATKISSIGVSKVAGSLGISPSASTNATLWGNSGQAADALSQIFAGILNAGRSGATSALAKATCGFYGDAAMADPAFGNSLFNPTQISSLNSAFQLANFTDEEQALLASFYQSAMGTVGGIFIQQNGCDYHGASVQDTIAPSDFEAGRMFAMFLAACDVAGTKGAMISLHNGQAIANGTVAATVNGLATMGPSAQGDAGGSYNAGFILCYDPSSAPSLSTTGTFDTSSGNVKPASAVSASNVAVSGLYLTAFAHLGLDVNAAVSTMQKFGLSSGSVSPIMLIS